MSSVKLLVAFGVKNGWELRQLDVKQAFIQADLDFNVLIKLPGDCGDKSCKVVKLSESVYGLKQAGRRWAMHLDGVIVRKIGMEQFKADPFVFRLIRDGVVVMIVCVHVDTLLLQESLRRVIFRALVFLRSSKLREGKSRGTEGARLSVIGKEAFFAHRRERLSSLLSVDMELTQCLIARLLNQQISALGGTTSRSVINRFVHLLVVWFG